MFRGAVFSGHGVVYHVPRS